MPEFIVNVKEVHIRPYKVEAKNAVEALHIVENGKGTILEDEMEYSHTLDSDEWDVILLKSKE